MNGRVLIVAIIFTAAGCRGEYALDTPEAETGERMTETVVTRARTVSDADTLRVDATASEVAWIGTKMWGRGGHTGTVPVESGWIARRGDMLVGGRIVIDMTSIGITDIPPDQPEPIELLTSHLEDPLFFHVEKYPRASFEISDSAPADDNGLLIVDGLMTIRDVTRPIRIPVQADRTRTVYRSSFRIDRFDWNVAYEGGFGATRFAARNFVDRDIELDIRLDVEK